MTKPDSIDRRRFNKLLAACALAPATVSHADVLNQESLHEDIATAARRSGDSGPLQVLIPFGSGANVRAATDEFTRLSGIDCEISEVPVDEINVEMILRNSSGGDSLDVALPATFGLPDLVEAGAIEALDDLARRFEPTQFAKDMLYRRGDYYQGHLYGYQTDGDAYMLFYNKRLLENPAENKAFEQLVGRPLRPAHSWKELDEMMAFFHRPDENQFGGCLFRNSGYLVWEWWARAHAKGIFPLADDMTPLIDSDEGIAALEELIAASNYQTPASTTNGLFENWKDFSTGNVFCNIGWGGTQKHLMLQANMWDNLVHTPLPGIEVDGAPSTMGYFNWGWNYTLSSRSARKELGYLFALFCVTEHISTLAVREKSGYFDPFRKTHYGDKEIERAYGRSFLDAHQLSMQQSIPDFYLRGQGNYIDALRQQIVLALQGDVSPDQALQTCAKRWVRITRKLGIDEQREQWMALKTSYPETIASALRSEV